MLETYSKEQLQPLNGREVVDANGESVGYVDVIFADVDTDRAEWLGVWNGLPGSARRLVPILGAELVEGRLRVPWTADVVASAPSYDEEDTSGLLVDEEDTIVISPEKELAAYAYYGVEPLTAPPTEGVVRFRAWRVEVRR